MNDYNFTTSNYRRCPKCGKLLNKKGGKYYCTNGYCNLFATGPININGDD